MFAVEGKGDVRKLGKCGLPFWRENTGEMTLRVARVGTSKGVERSRDHQFQVAFSQNHVGVLPVQDFALLGYADLSGKSSCRLRIDRTMCSPAAAADGPATPVKQAQPYPTLACNLVQRAVGAEDLPGAGQHPTVFVGVGIAEHDLLGVVPRFQQFTIAGGLP